MKLFLPNILSVMLLSSLFCIPIVAANYQDAYQDDGQENCCAQNSGCLCNPLCCGAFDIQIQGGIAPIIWTDRGNATAVICSGAGINPVETFFGLPKYRTFFRLPFIVGAQVGYAVGQNCRIYGEFDYLQSRAKSSAVITTLGALPNTITFAFSKYKLFDAYLGARYYTNRLCDRASLFVGAKVGLTHHKRVSFSSTITPPVPTVALTTDLPFFVSNTVPSGGFNVGIDYCFCGVSIVLTGEVVASCGPRGNANIAFGQPAGCSGLGPTIPMTIAGFYNLFIGGIGTEIRFPITLGLRYSF